MNKKPLTIAIDCRMLGWGGIGRYTRGLIYGLRQIDSPHTYKLICNPENKPEISDTGNFVFIDNIDPVFSLGKALSFSSFVNRLGVDVFHSPHFTYPWLYKGRGVATIHDLIPIKYPITLSLVNRYKFTAALKLTLNKANAVIAVSESTKKDLNKIYSLPDSKSAVIYEAADNNFYPRNIEHIQEIKQKYKIETDYILYVGSYKPHKNVPGLIKAFEKLENRIKSSHKLVLVGSRDARYREADRLIKQFNLSGHITQIESIGDDDLAALYSGAKMLVFPSFYEGFGLPALEAMACGVPVLTSDNSSLIEMYNGKALIVDPGNIEDIARGIANIIGDSKLRSEMIINGSKYVRSFSWEKMARQTVNVYECVISL